MLLWFFPNILWTGYLLFYYSYLLKVATSSFFPWFFQLISPYFLYFQVFPHIQPSSLHIWLLVFLTCFQLLKLHSNCLLNMFILMFAGIWGLICPDRNSLFPQHLYQLVLLISLFLLMSHLFPSYLDSKPRYRFSLLYIIPLSLTFTELSRLADFAFEISDPLSILNFVFLFYNSSSSLSRPLQEWTVVLLTSESLCKLPCKYVMLICQKHSSCLHVKRLPMVPTG